MRVGHLLEPAPHIDALQVDGGLGIERWGERPVGAAALHVANHINMSVTSMAGSTP
jgi:hypothetical protein